MAFPESIRKSRSAFWVAMSMVRATVVAPIGIAILSESSYPPGMKGITIKLPEETLRRLQAEARSTGRSVAALIRERIETPPDDDTGSFYALTSDLAGTLAGGRAAATNKRRRFRRA